MTRSVSDDEFRRVLTGEDPGMARFRNVVKHFPASPRCKLCLSPFEGIGGAVFRRVGFSRYPGNPAMCSNCINDFRKKGLTGAEIPVSLLFADVRGSTGIAEAMRPAEFRAFLGGFYRVGSEVILGHDGLVDKLVGDEIIGLFFGGITGPQHVNAAIEAAIELVRRVGRPDASPRGAIPLGAGVHTGEAYVGTTGPAGAVDDFTALGDVVNSTARLASSAAAGEILVTVAATDAAGYKTSGLERRNLEVRGRHEPIDVVVIRP